MLYPPISELRIETPRTPAEGGVYPTPDPQVACVGVTFTLQLPADTVTLGGVPPGLRFFEGQLTGVPTEAGKYTLVINTGLPTQRSFTMAIVRGGAFTPTLTPEISSTTFDTAEGTWCDVCDTITFSSRFNRKVGKHFRHSGFGSFSWMLWQGSTLLIGGLNEMEKYNLPNPASPSALVQDTTFTDISLPSAERPKLVPGWFTLSPDGNWLYYIREVPGATGTHQLRRYNISTRTVDSTYSPSIAYGGTQSGTTAWSAIAMNSTHIFVCGARYQRYIGTDTTWPQLGDHEYTIILAAQSFIEVYTHAGVAQTALRRDFMDSLNFSVDGSRSERPGLSFKDYEFSYDPDLNGLNSTPAIYATPSKLYIAGRSSGVALDHEPFVVLNEYPIAADNTFPTKPVKTFLLNSDGIGYHGLYRDTTGDFYLGWVTDETRIQGIGGLIERGVVRIPNDVYENTAITTEYADIGDQLTEYVDINPPDGSSAISNGVGTVSNFRGEENLSRLANVQDVNNKLRVTFPSSFQNELDIFVTGQYRIA